MNLVRENIAKMEGYTPGEQPRDRAYVKLNTNENPYPPSPEVFRALREFDPARLRLYSEPLSTELREIAGSSFGLDKDWVIAGNGSDDLLTIAMRTFVDQDGRCAYTHPSYSLYPVLADLQAAQHVVVELDESFELPGNAAELAKPASLFIVCRPNAPTGNAFPLATMHRVCRKFPGVVWIDEAYVDFADESCMEFVKQYPNVVVSRTLSKSYSMAGVRLGLAFASPAIIAEMMKVKDSYNVDMLAQTVGAAALRDRAYMVGNSQRIRETRDRITTELAGLGFDTLPSQTNFILTRPPMEAAEMFAALRGKGFLVRYFSDERIRDRIRVTIGTDADMTAFVQAVREILEEREKNG
jgi:histidinol-phosphate aminotransferase